MLMPYATPRYSAISFSTALCTYTLGTDVFGPPVKSVQQELIIHINTFQCLLKNRLVPETIPKANGTSHDNIIEQVQSSKLEIKHEGLAEILQEAHPTV